MNLEITEEERDFLELLCEKAERLTLMGIETGSNLQSILRLKLKLVMLDANRIKKVLDKMPDLP